MAPGLSLYRFSAGHGGLQCSACHGSTHAEFPSSHDNDNVQSLQIQGHSGPLAECASCHPNGVSTISGGPHGMHPVGQSWISGHKDAAGGGASACQACHGTDYRGTVLSRSFADRTLSTEFGTKQFWNGFQIGCYTCHNGPNSESANPNVAPVVTDLSASTTAGAPVAVALHATDANNNPLALRIVSQPKNGTTALSGTTATYYPYDGFSGTDTFTYAANDSQTDSNLGHVAVNVGGASGCSVTCSASAPSSVQVGSAASFAGTATASSCAGSLSYDWNFGDGSAHASTAGASHAYASAGTYTWVFTATADTTSCTKSGTITVSATSCTVTCSATVPSTGQVRQELSFSGSASSSCQGEILYQWQFGDGTDPSGDAYMAGYTNSNNFPTLNPLQPTYAGVYPDAFLTRFSAGQMVFSTYLGGSAIEYVYGLAVDHSGTAYVSGNTGSVNFPTASPLQADIGSPPAYHSTDGGVTFPSSSSGLSATDLNAFLADPTSPGRVFAAGGYDGLYKSADSGATWTRCTNGLPPTSGSAYASCLAFVPGSPARILAGIYFHGLYQSTDGGSTWAFVPGTGTKSGLMVLVSDPANPNRIFMGTNGQGFHVSMDGGMTWSPVAGYATDATVSAVTFAPSNPQILFVGLHPGGMFKSIDGGDTWTSTRIRGTTVECILFRHPSPSAPADLFVGGSRGSDAFLAKVSADGQSLLFSTFFGGTGYESSGYVALDAWENILLTGSTVSHDFPTLNPRQGQNNAPRYSTVFLAKIRQCTLDCSATAPGQVSLGQAASFSASSTATDCYPSASYDWNFGDGSPHSTQQNPSHTYTQGGIYTWTLTATAGDLPCSKTGDLKVCGPACAATATPSQGVLPLLVHFASQSTLPQGCSGTLSYDWDFGDGSLHGTSASADHTYATANTFNWTLTVTDGVGGSCQNSGTVTAASCTPAAIVTQPLGTTIPSGGSTTLTVTASGGGTLSYQWYQGASGNTSTPVGTNAATYTTPALTVTTSYWVRVSNGCGTPADSSTATVSVCTLTCSATVPAAATVGLAASFTGAATLTGSCTGAPSFSWTFGDGSTSTAQNPTHVYATTGTRNWTLMVTFMGQVCPKMGSITVVNPPVITLMKKASPPFKIVVTGTNLQNGIRVFIDGAEWTSVAYKKSTKIQLTGSTLKTAVPKGTTKPFRFLNPDGGEFTTTWGW